MRARGRSGRRASRAARLQTLVEILLVDGQRSQLLTPARSGWLPVEPVLEVVDQQRLDIGRIAIDLLSD